MKKTTEQKECECHCHHHGNCVEDAACIAMYYEHCHPQPTDGQKIYFSGDDLHWKSQKENCKEGNHTFVCKCECGEELDIEEFIRADRAEQKQKTREDTIDEVLRALELNDDHEVPKIVIKALKSI